MPSSECPVLWYASQVLLPQETAHTVLHGVSHVNFRCESEPGYLLLTNVRCMFLGCRMIDHFRRKLTKDAHITFEKGSLFKADLTDPEEMHILFCEVVQVHRSRGANTLRRSLIDDFPRRLTVYDSLMEITCTDMRRVAFDISQCDHRNLFSFMNDFLDYLELAQLPAPLLTSPSLLERVSETILGISDNGAGTPTLENEGIALQLRHTMTSYELSNDFKLVTHCGERLIARATVQRDFNPRTLEFSSDLQFVKLSSNQMPSLSDVACSYETMYRHFALLGKGVFKRSTKVSGAFMRQVRSRRISHITCPAAAAAGRSIGSNSRRQCKAHLRATSEREEEHELVSSTDTSPAVCGSSAVLARKSVYHSAEDILLEVETSAAALPPTTHKTSARETPEYLLTPGEMCRDRSYAFSSFEEEDSMESEKKVVESESEEFQCMSLSEQYALISLKAFKFTDKRVGEAVQAAGWLRHVSYFLRLAEQMVDGPIREGYGRCVVVHGRETAHVRLVSALLQLLCRPERRTVRGFQDLVESEWLSGFELDLGRRSDNQPQEMLHTVALDKSKELLSNVNSILRAGRRNSLGTTLIASFNVREDKVQHSVSDNRRDEVEETLGMRTGKQRRNHHSVRVKDQLSPAFFLLFLDCVHQMAGCNPTGFQFTEQYLVQLWNWALKGMFVGFSGDRCGANMWDWGQRLTAHTQATCLNPLYSPPDDPDHILDVRDRTTVAGVELWESLFCQWHPAGGRRISPRQPAHATTLTHAQLQSWRTLALARALRSPDTTPEEDCCCPLNPDHCHLTCMLHFPPTNCVRSDDSASHPTVMP